MAEGRPPSKSVSLSDQNTSRRDPSNLILPTSRPEFRRTLGKKKIIVHFVTMLLMDV